MALTDTERTEIVEEVIAAIKSAGNKMQNLAEEQDVANIKSLLALATAEGNPMRMIPVSVFTTEKTVTWSGTSNIDSYTTAGVYNITGERTSTNDNLPISNTGGGHSIHARLVVLDSSISDTTNSDDKCITQILSMSNRVGGDGNVYIRTGQGVTKDNITWEEWATLQTNINVGQVATLDDLIDNGIYSGVWTTGSYNAYPLTFVCITINDYFVGISPRRISQFVYGLSKFDGSVVFKSRVWDDNKNTWGDWEEIGGGGSYTLPVATTNVLGGVKSHSMYGRVGTNEYGEVCALNVSGDGIASVTIPRTDDYDGQYGLVKVDASINPESKNPVSGKAVAETLEAAVAETLEAAVAKGRELAKRDLYISAGALYNDTDEIIKRTAFWGDEVDHLPKHYYLNGLGDITEEQMAKIYNIKDWTMLLRTNGSRLYQYSNIRTMCPVPYTRTWEFDAYLSMEAAFYSSNIEVIYPAVNVGSMRINSFTCSGATKLKFIGGVLDCSIRTQNVIGFQDSVALEFVKVTNIRSDISFVKSSKLRKECVLFLINNVYKSLDKAITVTLHKSLYEKCVEGGEWFEEVNTALETANAAITGGGSINIASV